MLIPIVSFSQVLAECIIHSGAAAVRTHPCPVEIILFQLCYMSWQQAFGTRWHQTCFTPGMHCPWSCQGTPMAEAGRGASGSSYPGFCRAPEPCRNGTAAADVPLQPGPDLGTEVVVAPSLTALIPSQANSLIPSPVHFAQCLDPRLQRTYHGEKERGEGGSP